MINVTLTDDHPLIINGMTQLLESQRDITVTGRYTSGTCMLEGLQTALPDVALIDISMPDITGNDLCRLIHKQYPAVKLIALTSMDTPYQVKDMMRHGCSGYLLKTAPPMQIITAIRDVYAGQQYLEEEVKSILLSSMLDDSKTLGLTKRELEILQLICNGDTNPMIAKKLFLSLRTIENHRFALYEKLGAANTASLVKVALQKGLVQ